MTSSRHPPWAPQDAESGGSGSLGLDDLDWGDPVAGTPAKPAPPPAAASPAPAATPRPPAAPAPLAPPVAPASGAPADNSLDFEPVIEWKPEPLPVAAPATPATPVSRAAPAAPAPSRPGPPRPSTAAPGAPAPRTFDYVAHRIRERYFRARFPEIEPPNATSPDPGPIIKSARLYFEDGDVARAVELLQQSSEILPREDRLLLAKLEIHFLSREAAPFAATAKIFEQRFPASVEIPKIRRMAERLNAEARVAAGAAGPDERYGAWPEIANWIEAPWDLTSEVLAVELRSRLLATPTGSDSSGGL